MLVVTIRSSPVQATSFRRGFPARPEELAQMRAEIRRWLQEQAVSSELQADLLLAVGEACANAVEHAYAEGAPGEVEIEIVAGEPAGGELAVRVRDFGRWREPSRTGVDRGRGTGVMRALVEDFRRETGLTGTSVSFRLREPRRDA